MAQALPGDYANPLCLSRSMSVRSPAQQILSLRQHPADGVPVLGQGRNTSRPRDPQVKRQSAETVMLDWVAVSSPVVMLAGCRSRTGTAACAGARPATTGPLAQRATR